MVVLVQADDADALGVASDGPDALRVDADPHDLAALCNEHEFVAVADGHHGDDAAVAVGALDVDDALAAAALDAVGVEGGPLAVAVLADGEQGGLLVDDGHADNLVALAEPDAAHARGASAHAADVGLLEPDGEAVARAEDDLVVAVRDGDVDEGVVLGQVDGDDAAAPRVAVLGQRRLLDGAPGGGEDELALLVELADGVEAGDGLVLPELEHVDDGPALGLARHLRDVVHLQPVALAAAREEQDVVVGGGDEEVLDEVAFLGGGPDDALAAAALAAVTGQRQAFDVALVADGDDAVLLGDEVFEVEVLGLADDLGPAGVGVLLFDFVEVLGDDVEDEPLVAQDGLVLVDPLADHDPLVAQFLDLQAGQLLEAQGQDGVGLGAGEVQGVLGGVAQELVGLFGALAGQAGDAELPGLLHEPLFGGRHVGALLDDVDDLVDVGHGVQQAEQNVLAGAGLLQQEHGPPPDDLDAVVLEGHQHVLQGHGPRAALVQGDVDDRERGLERRMLVQ